ncbi:MAG TPA: hypothetical protein VNX21_03495, partial [Candidatus Thermoplasmatota archaeon]|nr:hypothetical protein [Candidatus Thermoplasmatota archaeon]
MRALLLLALLVAPLAAAHPDAADHGVAQVAPHAGAPASRLIEGCRFVVRGEVQDGVDAADEGRVVVLASDGAGGLRVALEGEWQADANGTLRAGPLEAGPGVFLVGVELDEWHGIYSEAFRVDCLEPVCPPEGCP